MPVILFRERWVDYSGWSTVSNIVPNKRFVAFCVGGSQQGRIESQDSPGNWKLSRHSFGFRSSRYNFRALKLTTVGAIGFVAVYSNDEKLFSNKSYELWYFCCCFFVIFFLHSVPSWYLPKWRGLWDWVHNIVLDNTGIGATQWSIKLNVRWQLTVGEIKCFGRQRLLKGNYYGLWPLHLRSDRRWWLSINTFTPISVLMAFALRSSTVHQGSFYF